jgi:hypothetical protein
MHSRPIVRLSRPELQTIRRQSEQERRYPGGSEQRDVLEYANGKILPPPPSSPPKDSNAPIDFSQGRVLPDDWVNGDRVVSVNADGISDVLLDSAGAVASIHFTDGETVRKAEFPVFPFAVFLYPILGFLVPWGAIRTMTWIEEGFFRPRT